MDYKTIAISIIASVIISALLTEEISKPLDKRVSDLRGDHFMLDLKVDGLTSKQAYFTPADQGYSTISTPAGNLVVTLDSLQKYASGYKVFFNIGNPTLATFTDAKLKIKWNRE